MRKFVFATHGDFAIGIKNSVELILGKCEEITCLCAYVGENQNLTNEMKNILEELKDEDELIIITDLFGGSVNNELYQYIQDKRIQLISGLNLALVIQLLIGKNKTDVKELIRQSIENSKEGIIYCNDYVKKVDEDNF